MATFADLPHHQQERIVCSITAAEKYAVPANILLAIAEKENGKPGVWVKNTNGSHDVGPMQFNTAYLKTLAKYGISAEDVASSGCYAYDLAAWRVHGHLTKDQGDLWTRAANYHSRTLYHNTVYQADLRVKADRWAHWLAKFIPSTRTTITTYTIKHNVKQVSKASHKVQAVTKNYVSRTIIVSSQ
jgi:hypothetical protein